PTATRVWVVDDTGAVVTELPRLHPHGFFAGPTGRREPFRYRLRLETAAGTEEIEDPYRFDPILGDLDVYLIAEGRHLRLYEKLGAHPTSMDGVTGTTFAVWAPNARRVSVVGDFNGWDGRRHPMRFRAACGVWEIFIPGVTPGAC